MTKRMTITLVALALFVLLAVLPVSALTLNATNISKSGTVFVGESGLNITETVRPRDPLAWNPYGAKQLIAWFPSTAQTGATTPEKVIDVTVTMASFYVNPADFATRTGNWYCWSESPGTAIQNVNLAFMVADPQMDVKVWDLVQNTDVTGKSVPTGQNLTFRIETNTYTVSARPWILKPVTWFTGVNPGNSYYGINPATGGAATGPTGAQTAEGFVHIRVKTDQGNTLSALYNGSVGPTSVAIPLTGMFVDKQPWDWGNYSLANSYYLYWNTAALDEIGQKVYPAGTYTVYAELDLNAIKTNYKNGGADYAGKTISEYRTVTLVSDTVKIEANKDTVTRSKPFSVTITGKPATFYWVWLKGTGSMTGAQDDQPPMIPLNQLYVYNESPQDPAVYSYSDYLPEGKTGIATQNVSLQPNVGQVPFRGTRYWAMIKTSDAGTRVVEFTTSNQTKAQKYTIRVENNSNPGYSRNTLLASDYKTDEVDVKVEKGTVTITAAGDGSYYLGEEVKFSGTNTETVNTFFFITGPNLVKDGSKITDTNPRAVAAQNLVEATFKKVPVASDNSWSWKWTTSTVALDAGTYTVYAVSGPNNAANLASVAYGTVSIIVKKPFVSATVSSSTVARGDSIFVRGIAEGKPSQGVMMWVLGKNYPTTSTDIKTTSVNSDATFEFEIKGASVTKYMAAGQYFVVVQHPMQNDAFDIKTGEGATTGTTGVFNMQLGPSRATGQQIFTLLGAGSLQGSDAAEALVQALTDPNVDDTYTKLQFLVEEPQIIIVPIGDKHVGDKFTINAATNLAIDDEVLVQVYSSSFKPTQKSQSGEFSGATGTVKVTKGETGMNTIKFDVDAATFKPDEYIVTESAVIQEATGTALFNVLEGAAPTVAPTVVVVVVPTAATTVPTTVPPTPIPTPTKSPGYGALIALIGLGAVAFIVVRRH